jgi:hemoglobin/transferrin/lactoferrin receptor protein
LGYQLHLGASYKINDSFNTSLLISSAYRAADLMERFKYISLGGNQSLYGEPTLKPEKSIFLEYSLDYINDNFSARLSLFSNIIKDYIAEKRESPTIIRLHNVRAARIMGAEISLDLRFHPSFNFYGNLSVIVHRQR